MHRFYPEHFPQFINEPLQTNFEIQNINNIYNHGIISKIKIPSTSIVFTFTGIVLPYRTLYTLEISEYLHIHDPYFMGKILHSCDPNLRVDMNTLTFYAIKPIEIGDLLTMDYETTESQLFSPFKCECRSPKCRSIIKGYAVT